MGIRTLPTTVTKSKYDIIELTMINLSFEIFGALTTQLYQKKGGHCFLF